MLWEVQTAFSRLKKLFLFLRDVIFPEVSKNGQIVQFPEFGQSLMILPPRPGVGALSGIFDWHNKVGVFAEACCEFRRVKMFCVS